MALTGTDRGAGFHATAATQVTPKPTSNYTPGTLAVLLIAYDNAGSAGADPYVSVSDPAGNIWTSRQNALTDPGAASAGIAMRAFTAYIWQLTTADGPQINFGGATPAAKAWAFHEIAGAAGSTAEYVTGGVANVAATANPTITTGTINIGDFTVAGMGSESTDAITPDSDTSNGSWTTHMTASAGLTTQSNIQITSQRKLQATANSTQTFNQTIVANDYCSIWVQVREVAIPTLVTVRARQGTT